MLRQSTFLVAATLASAAAFAPAAVLPRRPPLCAHRPPVRAGTVAAVAADAGAVTAATDAATSLLAFSDQGGNLAGQFFQYSLLPYVLFLYFLGYEKNNTPKQAMFGFQFLLLFVLSTVFTGIVTKSVYSSSLANVDWLHGAAEALLTTSNLYVATGFRSGNAGDASATLLPGGAFRYPAFAIFALVVAATAAGPSLGFEQHSAFLLGLGNLDANPLADVLAGVRAEPANALSIPTWAIHFSSVFEWLFAMGMVSQYAKATGNGRWKWLTYGMLPLHASGVAACTYHAFYNSADVSFLVTVQAGLTLLGNTTVFIAALLIALSNGWTLADANPFAPKDDEPAAAAAAADAAPALTPQDVPGAPLVAVELLLLTVLASYLMKYGEAALALPFEPNAIVAWLLVLAIPAGVGARFARTT